LLASRGAKRGSKRVLNGLISELTSPLKDALKLAGWGVAAAVPALLSFFFFLYAAFVWAERSYGTLEAALLLGAVFMVIASLIVATAVFLRRRAARRPRPRVNVQGLKDPTVLAAGLELVRLVGLRRIIPAVALGAVIFGALDGGTARKNGRDPR
jgi:hypothetical protein